jgi:hypothetical protein
VSTGTRHYGWWNGWVPLYQVHLEIRTARPLNAEQIAQLEGGKHEVLATGQVRSRRLTVTLRMEGGDVVGALARALNYVFDQVPGDVDHAQVTASKPRLAPRRGRS